MDQTFANLRTPYLGDVRLFQGTVVRVVGTPRFNAVSFAINLQTGPSVSMSDDIALQVRPCFSPPPRITRNSLINRTWGHEESWTTGPVPNASQTLVIQILVERECYKIALNGANLCEFPHRFPYIHVRYVTIDGDVDIRELQVHQPPGYGAVQVRPSPTLGPQPTGAYGERPEPSYPQPTAPQWDTRLDPTNQYSGSTGYPQSGPAPASGAYVGGGFPTPSSWTPTPSNPNVGPGPRPAEGSYHHTGQLDDEESNCKIF